MKTLLTIIFFTLLQAASAQKVTERSVRYRNINELINDTFYHQQKDTIFKEVHYPDQTKIKVIGVYLKKGKDWISYYPNGTIMEIGRFQRYRYSIRFVFRKKKYMIYKPVGVWKYYDITGKMVEERSYHSK